MPAKSLSKPVFLLGFLLAMGSSAAIAGIDITIPGLRTAAPTTPAQQRFEAGLAALRENDLAKAEAEFKESMKLDMNAPAPYIGLGQVAFRRGDTKAAESYFKKAVDLAPHESSVQTTWGVYLYSQRELPEAEAALRKAADSGAVAARIHLGDMYLVAFQKPDDAIREYRSAIAIAPEHPGAHYALGLALLTKSDFGQAELELQRAAKLASNNPLPHHALGLLYSAQQKSSQALTSFGAALKLFPGFSAAHVERGHVLARSGKDDAALVEYGEAQKKDPKHSTGYTNIGMLHQRQQRWKQAEDAYLAAIKIEPRNAVAYNNLAWMAAEQKMNLARGFEWATKAVSIAPQVPEFHVTLAWVHRAQGNLARAEQTLVKAAALKTSKATTFYYLGRVYLERGKKTQAIGEMKKALAREPNFPESADARKTLKELGQS